MREGPVPSPTYLDGLLRLIRNDEAFVGGTVHLDDLPEKLSRGQDSGEMVRLLDDLRHTLMGQLGIAVADWDLSTPASGLRPESETGRRSVGASSGVGLERVGIYLDSIRSPFNLGSMVRTAAAYGVRSIGLSPETVTHEHPRAIRSAMGSFDYVDIYVGTLAEFTAARFSPQTDVIALETDGERIDDFSFPVTGVLVLGSEELGIRPSVRAETTAGVRIPMYGEKQSLNVGVACGIALHAWLQSIAT